MKLAVLGMVFLFFMFQMHMARQAVQYDRLVRQQGTEHFTLTVSETEETSERLQVVGVATQTAGKVYNLTDYKEGWTSRLYCALSIYFRECYNVSERNCSYNAIVA